jgi:hypothetical protein
MPRTIVQGLRAINRVFLGKAIQAAPSQWIRARFSVRQNGATKQANRTLWAEVEQLAHVQ